MSARIIIRAMRQVAWILAGSYLALAALSIGYELSIRLFDPGAPSACASALPTARSS